MMRRRAAALVDRARPRGGHFLNGDSDITYRCDETVAPNPLRRVGLAGGSVC